MESTENPSEFVSNEYCSNLIQQLHGLWMKKFFCDIDICIGERNFQVHRNVLAASSPYFYAMLTSDMQEKKSGKIELHDIDPDVFQIILEFMYTGQIRITEDVCQDLFAAADLFGLCDIQRACSNFLIQQLDPSNCVGIYLLADAYSYWELQEKCLRFIFNQFKDVIQNDEFNIIPKDKLINILQSEEIKVDDEMQVLRAALDWIFYDLKERRKYVYDIIGCIRLPIIPFSQLVRLVEGISDISIKVALQKLLVDYRSIRKLPHHLRLAKVDTVHFQPRKCSRKKIFVIGGYTRLPGGRFYDIEVLGNVDCFDIYQQTWRTLPSLHEPRLALGVAAVNGLIYAIGGERDSRIFDSVECYDSTSNQWAMIPSMVEARSGLGVCVYGDNIVAAGGWVGGYLGSSIEMYDPVKNLWRIIGQMKCPRFAVGIVEHLDKIYIIGGCDDLEQQMKEVEVFDPVNDEWHDVPSVIHKRSHFGVCAVENSIYVIGGMNSSSSALRSNERYSPGDSKWTELPPMSVPRISPCVTAVNGLIYVFGGRSGTEHHDWNEYTPNQIWDSVECFDPSTNSWFEISPMPCSRCESGVTVL